MITKGQLKHQFSKVTEDCQKSRCCAVGSELGQTLLTICSFSWQVLVVITGRDGLEDTAGAV